MSFILEALKKSENKRRGKKSGRSSRSIYEPDTQRLAKSRFWFLGIIFVLFMNAALLIWFLAPWKQPEVTGLETSVSDSRPLKEHRNAADSAQKSSPELQPHSGDHKSFAHSQPQNSDGPMGIKALPLPRSDKQVYRFSQLPVTIQKQIPELRMSLHAFNRNDAAASLVQLNDRMLREKDMVTADISLEQIMADGVVLRYDGYRFLVPRRGN